MNFINELVTIIENHVRNAKQAQSHEAKLIVLSRLLEEFGVRLEDLLPRVEKRIKILGLRGRADLIFSDVVFEVKIDLRKELNDAKKQLIKYLQILHAKKPDERRIGMATDCIEFKAYLPVIKNGEIVDLKEIGSINLEKVAPQDFVLWFDSFIFSKVKTSAQDLKWRFGPGSPTYSQAVNELYSLWSEVENDESIRLKLDLWTKNMEIVYGSKPELSSFIDHTYLVNLVKLIVYLRLKKEDEVIDKGTIKEALTGDYFSRYGITNLIEEDFFTWILHPKIFDKALDLFYGLAKELLRYDFSQIDEDFFKEIYQEIVKREERHRIGEYYTPEWLVQLILKEIIDLWKENNRGLPRILDPACGSGTFLCNAIHMIRNELESKGEPPAQILDFILNNVVGIDINPLAVIIAKANYLIALGDLVQSGKPITIPVYVADSIKIPKVLATLAPGGSIAVYEINIDDHHIQLPKSVIDRKIISEVLKAVKDAVDAYKNRADKNEALKIFKRETSSLLTKDEFMVLSSTLNTILKLIDKGLDSIWVFMLRNVYAPIMLMNKFDIVVGNPPWIALRYIENKSYQDFLKEQIIAYGLLETKQVHLFTHADTATLFFCRTSDLYLMDGGLLAFVMPGSVLTGAFHHANFRQFKKPRMKLIKIYDLEKVKPLFNVPSCVLVAIKGKETAYPVPVHKYSGMLPEKNLKLAEAIKYLSISEDKYEPPEISTKRSYYHDYIKEGATIVPRCLYFIDFDVHPYLGIDVSKPAVKTSSDIEKKEPWKDIELHGNVEADFIYATLLASDLVPFGYVRLRPIVLPIEPTSIGYLVLNIDSLRNKGFSGIANWLTEAEKFWEERRTEKALKRFPSVLERLDYNGLLSCQNPTKRYVLLFNASGKNLVSCVVDKHSLPEFQVLKAKIKPKGFIADCATYFYETNDQNEAHYLCAILNSNIVNEKIKQLQPKGLFGERSIHRRPFMLPIPKFNGSNQLHVRLAELSKQCHNKIASLKLEKRRIGVLRKEAREAIKAEIAEIDRLVSRLLGMS